MGAGLGGQQHLGSSPGLNDGGFVAGDRIYIQSWYRDPLLGGAGFNISGGWSVLICP